MNKSKIGVEWTENLRGAAVIIDVIYQFYQSFDRTAPFVVSAIMGTGSAIIEAVSAVIGIGTAVAAVIYKFFSTGRGKI